MPISTPVQIELAVDERAESEQWARRHTSAQALASRSRVALLVADEQHRDRWAARAASVDGPQVTGPVHAVARGRAVR